MDTAAPSCNPIVKSGQCLHHTQTFFINLFIIAGCWIYFSLKMDPENFVSKQNVEIYGHFSKPILLCGYNMVILMNRSFAFEVMKLCFREVMVY